jgi:hypothetical protein
MKSRKMLARAPRCTLAVCSMALALIHLTSVRAPANEWIEAWLTEDAQVEGACESPEYTCSDSLDPEIAPYIVCYGGPTTWYTLPSTDGVGGDVVDCAVAGPNQCYDIDTGITPHELSFHGEGWWEGVEGGGWAMNSAATFDRTTYISVQARLKAYCGPTPESGCFAGLTLYNGETDYREIAYYAAPGTSNMRIDQVTPCFGRGLPSSTVPGVPLFPTNQDEWHTLRLDYYGQEGGKWIYVIDDIVVLIEDPSSNNAPLREDPRLGLYFVGFAYQAYVEGRVGPVRVWTGEYVDQQQPVQADGHRATTTTWFAQQVLTATGVDNVAKVELHLVEGSTYDLCLYTDTGGEPGNLINAVWYRADRTGFQDVPLLISSRFSPYWIIVKGTTTGGQDFGTGAAGIDSYAGEYMATTDGGVSWFNPDIRDMSFRTFSRHPNATSVETLPSEKDVVLVAVPNPFARSVELHYSLLREEAVRIRVMDVRGREVARVVDGMVGPGFHSISWDGKDLSGVSLPSGVYFARIEAGDAIQMTKLVRIQ